MLTIPIESLLYVKKRPCGNPYATQIPARKPENLPNCHPPPRWDAPDRPPVGLTTLNGQRYTAPSCGCAEEAHHPSPHHDAQQLRHRAQRANAPAGVLFAVQRKGFGFLLRWRRTSLRGEFYCLSYLKELHCTFSPKFDSTIVARVPVRVFGGCEAVSSPDVR